ncbi:hypothetical protein GCM10011375_18780 [Hymenobacter qilianensis]|uniref:Uncharacterized protein n=1 Tax=Hymenobacter qilianensis TaxID=1385715 RepID=A0ACB5PR57_9BACT|nr:hypothetical protein GCM10011375_18780 [Hymenobacter qilianensis]
MAIKKPLSNKAEWRTCNVPRKRFELLTYCLEGMLRPKHIRYHYLAALGKKGFLEDKSYCSLLTVQGFLLYLYEPLYEPTAVHTTYEQNH